MVEAEDIAWDATTNTLSGRARGNGGDETTLYFHLPSSFRPKEATYNGIAAETAYPEPSVLGLRVPTGKEFLHWKLRFKGDSKVRPARPFHAGRAATVK